jgi:hypothetical protein
MLKVFYVFCLLLFIIIPLQAQTSPVYYIANSFIYGAIDGTKEGMKLEDKYRELSNDPSSLEYNRAWHRWQFLSSVSGVALGFNIALYSYDDGKVNWLKTALSSFLSGIIFYNTREIFMNLTRGQDIFAHADQNISGVEQLRFFRIPLTILAIALNLLLLE